MKALYRKLAGAMAMMIVLLTCNTSCQEADPEFIHDNVLLSDFRLKTNPSAEGLHGTITEYDANGNVVPADMVTLKSTEGGYGVITFELSPSLKSVYNLESCYLGASLTFDQIITPGLAGLKNIVNRDANGVAQGIKITVTSGIKTTREYTVIGYFKGEYVLTEE